MSKSFSTVSMRIIVTNSHSPASETIMMQSVTRSNEVWHASHPADDKIRLRVRPAWFSSFERLKNSTRIVSFILFASSDTSLNLCIYIKKKKKMYVQLKKSLTPFPRTSVILLEWKERNEIDLVSRLDARQGTPPLWENNGISRLEEAEASSS